MFTRGMWREAGLRSIPRRKSGRRGSLLHRMRTQGLMWSLVVGENSQNGRVQGGQILHEAGEAKRRAGVAVRWDDSNQFELWCLRRGARSPRRPCACNTTCQHTGCRKAVEQYSQQEEKGTCHCRDTCCSECCVHAFICGCAPRHSRG